MIKKRKILFVLPSLKAGGAERVLSFLAKNISKKLFTVKLVVLGYKKDSCYNVDGVDVIYLNRPRLLMAVLPLFRFIRIHKPHIVFSSMGHVNMVLSLFSFFLPNITFVGREASVISKMNEYTERKNKFLFFQKTLYKRLDKIVCQSTDMKNDLIAVFNINPEKLIIINNPITEIVKLKKFKKKSSFKFITIGRLSMEKGYLRILNALSKIESYDFNYTIIGSGYLEKQIKVRVENLGLGNKVNFIPHTYSVLDILMEHDCFIQGSYVEGFPNALLESCSVGTPVIAFDAPGGTKEIIKNGENGFIVNSELELDDLLSDKEKLQKMNREQVVSTVIKKFNSIKIIKQYEALFSSL